MLFFTESDVRRLLPMPAAVTLMGQLFEKLRSGQALNQPRRRLVLPTSSVLHYMAGWDGNYFGAKIYSTHPKHGAYFLFLLYRGEDALPLALFEANYLGQIRTGAASGYATGLLARTDAAALAVIGSGFQARTQVEAVLAVRPIRSVRIWSRSEENRCRFAAALAADFGVAARAAATAREAVRDADIIVTATNSREPVIESGWVADGAHINAMGSNRAASRELPTDLILRANLIAVDSLEQARIESGDLLLAVPPDQWDSLPLVELREAPSRPSDQAVTIFKSNGLAAQDVAAAGFVYESALRAGGVSSLPILAG
jgi:ornithine cyclodeaminase/alanine dehydrogenase-like protein (mu-crystallin family)